MNRWPHRIKPLMFLGLWWSASLSIHGEEQEARVLKEGELRVLEWQGVAGRTYFVQVSDSGDPLGKWVWAPVIEEGKVETIRYEFGNGEAKGFVRLHYTDEARPEGMPVEEWDADGDGLGNLREVMELRTDPLKKDTDGDGLRDGWEVKHGLDATKADSDGNGVNDGEEDKDGDGVSAMEEQEEGTDLEDGEDFPVRMLCMRRSAAGTFSIGEAGRGYWEMYSKGPGVGASIVEAGRESRVLRPLEIQARAEQYEFPEEVTEDNAESYPGVRVFESSSYQEAANERYGTGYVGQSRVWLKVSPSQEEREFPLFLVEERTRFQPDLPAEGEIASVEPVKLVVPAGSKYSSYVDLKALGEVLPGGTSHVRVDLVSAGLVPDYNRDGRIDRHDRGKVTEERPWRWWVNDDDDVGEAAGGKRAKGDIPRNGTPDHSDDRVDGMRDLIDFFPLYPDLEMLLDLLPAEKYQYYVKHSEEAFQFFDVPMANPEPEENSEDWAPDFHFTHVARGRGFAHKELQRISSSGVRLRDEFLYRAKEGRGCLFLEATSETNEPLQLEIRKGDQVLVTLDLPMKISEVEKMYRHVDLTQVPVNYDGSSPGASPSPLGTRISDPGDPYPDQLTNGKYFIFVHGFNVSSEKARGWHAEIFKRLHQKGSRARFVGVTWNGDTGLPGIIPNVTTADYHKAVFFAFQTGDALRNALSFTEGTDTTVAAHSLGNVVVGQAIAVNLFTPSRYYIVNGAVPLQAYDESQIGDEMRWAMTERDWKPFGALGQQRLYASNWHTLFSGEPNDPRNFLTWKNRFQEVVISKRSYNFYSTGDEVVQNPTTDSASLMEKMWKLEGLSRGAWAAQEFVKGGTSLAALAQSRHQGGWGFNIWPFGYYKFHEILPDYDDVRPYKPQEARDEITNQDLAENPFFTYFLERDLFDPEKGPLKATENKVQYDLMASGIPAMSYAIASNPLSTMVSNENMNRFRTQESQWPEENHDNEDFGEWLHSDFRDVGMNYIHQLYRRMIQIGNLDQ